ncbi:MAG: ATP-binding protein [Methylococcaceae bacterium]
MKHDFRNDIFQAEYKILDAANNTLQNPEHNDNEIRPQFEELYGGYQKLLQQSIQLVTISDRQQDRLFKLQDKLKNALIDVHNAKEVAESANQAKSTFVATISHEIRTPLNAILGFAQLMQRDKNLSPQSSEHLNIINQSGEHLLALINDILEISKIEAGRSTFIPATFDLHSFIHNICRMFRLRTNVKDVKFLLEKQGTIPQWIITDVGKLRQILINLLGNAVKFTEHGGIILRLSATNENHGEVNLHFEVEDTGPGIAEEEICNLFQAFEQTKSGIRAGGTGLGLALSRGFLEKMGGNISVSSSVGKGSIFSFNIPVKKGSEESAVYNESKQRVISLKPGQESVRVLITDDSDTTRLLISQLLSVVGFETQETINGEEAVQMTIFWKPHVVLMDMAMPVMDGYEAIRRIKTAPESCKTVIIAITASAFEENRKQALAAGADVFLAKPFKDVELLEAIARLTGVEYLYEELDAGVEETDTSDKRDLMHKGVAALPSDFVLRMLNAVESADLDLLNEFTSQLSAEQPLLSKQIQKMAARYEYDALIELFSNQE